MPGYVDDAARAAIMAWLGTLHPLWEQRYSTVRPPPPGRQQKALLRPVYWLGNWQFACLGYYDPPRGVVDRCVEAEPLPPPLAAIAADVEARVRRTFVPADPPANARGARWRGAGADHHSWHVPPGWCLNTCLVNFYGNRREGARWVDVARVGEHRDHEPGPVASVSLGERALFQFVARGQGGAPVRSQWLDDGSLQVFGGPRWKDDLLHRVQRVDRKLDLDLPPAIEGFRTRRINFTFRFVPPAHVVPFARLGPQARADVVGYVDELAAHSLHFRAAAAGIARGA